MLCVTLFKQFLLLNGSEWKMSFSKNYNSIFLYMFQDLLASLNQTKMSSAEISESLVESCQIQKELDKECEVYQSLAEFGGNLYFAIGGLVRIQSIYQFSVKLFTRLFKQSLAIEQVDIKMITLMF